jgi:hypothetical protein
MRPTATELLFLGCGAALGGLVALAVRGGQLSPSGALPPFAVVLIGMALVEVVAGLALRRAPGTLIGMPARIGAFLLGVVVLAALGGLG